MTPVVPDLTPDENSLVVVAFFQVCNAGDTNVAVSHQVNYGNEIVKGQETIALSATDGNPVRSNT